MDNTKYYVVKKKAVPEVLIKVVETKRLLATRRGMTIQEATEEIGISRSSFYKYKDDIFPFHENEKGRTVTMVIQLDDTPGVMAELLNAVARYQANILTIHQTIPINGVASLTLSVEVLPTAGDASAMIEKIDSLDAECETILKDSRARGEAIREALVADALEEAEKIRNAAHRAADSETKKAIEELRSQMADEIVQAVEATLKEKLDMKKHVKLIDNALKKVVLN